MILDLLLEVLLSLKGVVEGLLHVVGTGWSQVVDR